MVDEESPYVKHDVNHSKHSIMTWGLALPQNTPSNASIIIWDISLIIVAGPHAASKLAIEEQHVYLPLTAKRSALLAGLKNSGSPIILFATVFAEEQA
jgi:hypothetical protein